MFGPRIDLLKLSLFSISSFLMHFQNELRILSAQPTFNNHGSSEGETVPSILFSHENVSDPAIEFESYFMGQIQTLVGFNDKVSFDNKPTEQQSPVSSNALSSAGPASSTSVNIQPSTKASGVVSSLTRALCYVNRVRHNVPKITQKPCRVLILEASNDQDHQFNAAMNCIFAAENHEIMVGLIYKNIYD
jgi:hypothetical protein